MIKTLKLSFSLKNTYRVNAILHALKQVPLLKKALPDTLYRVRGLKVFATVLSVLWELFTAFWGKFFYLLVMVMIVSHLYPIEDTGSVFMHILVFLTIIGGFLNAYMFDAEMNTYYAIVPLRMNAKEYVLINFGYALIEVLIGFVVFGLIFGLLAGLSFWQCLLIPVYVMSLKLCYVGYDLWTYEKTGTSVSEKDASKFRVVALVILLAAAYGLPAFGIVLPRLVSVIVMSVGALLGLLSIRRILKFEDYGIVARRVLNRSMDMLSELEENPVAASRNAITTDKKVTSEKKGFEYLNELFIKRHRKLLWKKSKQIALASLVLMIGAMAIALFVPEMKTTINEGMLKVLPCFAFIMYGINRGTELTQAMFVNCDRSLLTYSFYKEPGCILKLFTIRLREIIKVNLLPAVVIGPGLALILLVSGGTDNPLNYVVLVVSILCMSIFFSVHYLTIYYLLQPYTVGTEMKNALYSVVSGLTYVACYMLMQAPIKTLVFGIGAIAFCVIYCVVACLLVYKLAPRTFKLRNG